MQPFDLNHTPLSELLLKLYQLTQTKLQKEEDDPIQHMLEWTGRYFECSRIALFLIDEHEHYVHLNTEWKLDSEISHLDMMQSMPIEMFQSSWIDPLHREQKIIIDDIKQTNHLFIQDFYTSQEAKTIVIMPLFQDRKLYGWISYQYHQKPYPLTQDVITGIELVNHLLNQHLNQYRFTHTHQFKQATQALKQQFLSNLSHELKTPLGGILNAMSLLDTPSLSQEQKNYLDMGKKSFDQMTRFIDDLLDLSLLESGMLTIESTPFLIEDEVIRVYQKIRHQTHEKGVFFQFYFDPKLPLKVIGDQKKFRHILQSILILAGNMAYKSNITFIMMVKNEQPLRIFIDIQDPSYHESTAQIDHLFDLFQQPTIVSLEHKQLQSLSLPMAKELVLYLKGSLSYTTNEKGINYRLELPFERVEEALPQLNKSYIIAKSPNTISRIENTCQCIGIDVIEMKTYDHQPIDGIIIESDAYVDDILELLKEISGKKPLIYATSRKFNLKQLTIDHYIDLPVSRQQLYQILTSQENIPSNGKEKTYHTLLSGHVLIVDDNRLNRIALENILSKIGMKSTSVKNGLESIEAVKNMAFDMILMDIQMPGMDGIEATRRIRALGKSYEQIPIIAVTANAFFKDYDLMKHAKINDVIFKPIKVDELNLMLRKYVESGIQIQVPNELFTFDEKDFNTRFDGSEDIAKEIMSYFMESYPKDIIQIRNAVTSKDLQKIIETTHYFKGSCAYLSGKRAVWVLNQMMDLAKKQDIEQMDIYQHMLEHEVSELAKRVKEYQNEYSNR